MSDFLRNLRSTHKKTTSDPKRNLDGHFYPQNDRRKNQDRRTGDPETLEFLLLNLGELLPQMADNAATVTALLEKLLSENELLVAARIRQHNAISVFFDNLNKILKDDFSAQAPGNRAKPTASYASGTHYMKDDILNIITSMRKEGATFATIAEYLKETGIPTFSGRGEWHAQTIHRLCK